jgi:hypothetical protein
MGRLVCVEVRDIFEGVFGAAGLGALRMPSAAEAPGPLRRCRIADLGP